jgi:hypothetical protein
MNSVVEDSTPARLFAATLLFCSGSGIALAAPPVAAAKPIEVMVVGVFHMANPNHDLHDFKVDDVLEPKRQAEIAAVTSGLSRFRPTKIGVEWPAEIIADRYAQFLAGTLPPARKSTVSMPMATFRTNG